MAAADAFIPLAQVEATPEQLRDSARHVFDGIAALYDAARPGYPEALFEDLVADFGLSPRSHVLEIGCGTGQATRDLALRAGSIRCVEPGGELAALAQRNLTAFPDVAVEVSTFEDAAVEPASYDAVFSATAFHWVDAAIGYAKAAMALRPGGRMLLVTNAHAHGGTQHLIDQQVRAVHRQLAPEIGEWQFPTAARIAERAADAGPDVAHVWAAIERSFSTPPDTATLFEPVVVRHYPWIAEYDRDGYLAMLASQSGYQRLPQRERLLTEVGALIDTHLDGRISKAYVTVLAAARRR